LPLLKTISTSGKSVLKPAVLYYVARLSSNSRIFFTHTSDRERSRKVCNDSAEYDTEENRLVGSVGTATQEYRPMPWFHVQLLRATRCNNCRHSNML